SSAPRTPCACIGPCAARPGGRRVRRRRREGGIPVPIRRSGRGRGKRRCVVEDCHRAGGCCVFGHRVWARREGGGPPAIPSSPGATTRRGCCLRRGFLPRGHRPQRRHLALDG